MYFVYANLRLLDFMIPDSGQRKYRASDRSLLETNTRQHDWPAMLDLSA